MAVPKNGKKKKSLLKSSKEIKTAELSSGDIRAMASDSMFRAYLEKKGMNVDKIPTKEIMFEEYMKYLDKTGQ
tara:strand:- start:1167 stop:1385 length:219 start_codon:yes stop_codon:yes gene_type:complete